MAPVTANRRTVIASILLFVVGVFGGLRLAVKPDTAPAPPEPELRTSAAARDPMEPAALSSSDEPFSDLDPGLFPAGDGVIRGTVKTEDGRPVAGVTVQAKPRVPYHDPRRGGPPPPGDPLWPGIEMDVRAMLLERLGVREATSDDAGAFLLAGISDLEYRITAHRVGYRISRVGRGRATAGDEVGFIAHPVVELVVHVVGPDGEPPEHAMLNIHGVGRSAESNRPWRPAHPRIELDPGPIRIRALAGEGYPLSSAVEKRLLEIGIRPEPVVLRLAERLGIRGTITFPPLDTFGSIRYKIFALRIREGSTPDPSRLLREYHHEGRLGRYSPGRGTGRFCLTDLPVGTYLIGVTDGYKAVIDSRVVRVAEGMETVDLAVPLPGAGEVTKVRVLNQDGQPIRRGVSIRARHVAADGTITSESRTDLLGEGAWRVRTPVVPLGKEAGGRFLLLIRSEKHGRMTVEYAPHGAGEIEVRFAPPTTLTVILPNYPGSIYEGTARVSVSTDRPREEQYSFPEEQRPGPHGKTTFGPLAPGEWVVRLLVDTGTFGADTVLEMPIRLASGDEEVVLDPPPLFDLTVVVLEGEATFRLVPRGTRESRSGGRSPDGTVRFLRLKPGTYAFWRYEQGKSAGMTFKLGGDRTVHFKEEVFDARRVWIRDRQGTLYAAGLREGDLVVAIAGTEILNPGQGFKLINRHIEAGPVELNVLRGGSRLTVMVDLRGIHSPSRCGGGLQSWPR